jgi:predicted Rossmann-fold nucleotide-binding protein
MICGRRYCCQGLGTFEESFFEMLTWAQLTSAKKTNVVLIVNGFMILIVLLGQW